MILKKVVNASIWGFTLTLITGLTQFISIPILLNKFGKEEYGILILTLSIFSYLRMLDLGIPTSSIKFGAGWTEKGEEFNLKELYCSSILFYLIMGLASSGFIVGIGFFGDSLFSLSKDVKDSFFILCCVFGLFSFFEWCSVIFIVYFSIHQKVDWINKVSVVKPVILLAGALLISTFDLSINVYACFYIISILIQIFLYAIKIKSEANFFSLELRFNSTFKGVIKYGLNLFIMRLFQVSANYLRPIILGLFSLGVTTIITDYHIIETFSVLLISFGGVFGQILLPLTSKFYSSNKQAELKRIIYTGTKLNTIFISLLMFVLIINIESILILYLGENNMYLSKWIVLALISQFGLHSSPLSSLIIASGKIRPILVFSSINCIVSLIFLYKMVPTLGVGAAIISLFIYNMSQQFFSYFYYAYKYFSFNSKKLILDSFLLPFLYALFVAFFIFYLSMHFLHIENHFQLIALKTFSFCCVYIISSFYFLISEDEINFFSSNFKK